MPVFSFQKLTDVDMGLGPEMKSTGEVLGIDTLFPQALLKAFKGAGMELPKAGSNVIVTVNDEDKGEALPIARSLEELGVHLYGTEGTCRYLTEHGVHCQKVNRIGEEGPTIGDMVSIGMADMVINTPNRGKKADGDGWKIRRMCSERSIPCITAIDTARAIVTARRQGRSRELQAIDVTKL